MKKIERITIALILVGVLLFVMVVIFFLWLEIENLSTQKLINSEKFGQIGDFIGGIVGTFWALAGVLLFYLALREQRKDIQINQETLKTQVTALNQQIKEFKLQTEELEQTREVFKEQSETLRIQRFENTFFQLLQLNQEIVDKLWLEVPNYISYSDKDQLEKREVLSKSIRMLNDSFDNSLKEWKDVNGKTQLINIEINNSDEAYTKLIEGYSDFYFDKTKQSLSHYYRNIYHIFKFIYKSELIGKEKKQFYASLARAQLSSDELLLICYNSLVENLGKPNFLFLIKEFDILQNFDFELISRYKFHLDIYKKEIKNVKKEFE